MTLKCKDGVVASHPFTVVAHPHQTSPSEFDVDHEARRSGVDGILDELLYHRRRALDDLAGGDLICQIVGQDPYLVHLQTHDAMALVVKIDGVIKPVDKINAVSINI